MARVSWWSYRFEPPAHISEAAFDLLRRDQAGYAILVRRNLKKQFIELLVGYRYPLLAVLVGALLLPVLGDATTGWRFWVAMTAVLSIGIYGVSFFASVCSFAVYAVRFWHHSSQLARVAQLSSTYVEFVASARIRELLGREIAV